MLKIKLMKMTKLFNQRNLVIVDPNITQWDLNLSLNLSTVAKFQVATMQILKVPWISYIKVINGSRLENFENDRHSLL